MTPAEQAGAENRNKAASDRRRYPHSISVFKCRMAEMRAEQGLVLRDVSEKTGMSITGLWQIEQGSDPLLSTAIKLSAFFGKPINEIWERP